MEYRGGTPDGQPNGEGQANGIDNDAEAQGDGANADDRPKDAQPTGVSREPVENKERITTPYMTKYERARLLGTRALQIR